MTVQDKQDSESDFELEENSNFIPSSTSHIERKHNNAGYLDGITASKQDFLQEGFNSSYSHGAEMGLEAGYLLGLVQAGNVVQALNSRASSNKPEDWTKTFDQASSNDLGPKDIFGATFYEKSTTKFPRALYNSSTESFGSAKEHPNIKKWEKKVSDELSIKPC